MFGYVRPVTAELKVREHELYRAVYCGLCHSLGRCTGCASRLTLSYDFVFLALLRMSLAGERGRIVQKRCAVHPTKKRAMLTDSRELDTCARLSALLTYHKVKDNVADSGGIRRMGAALLTPAASGMKRRAGISKEAEGFVAEKLSELSELEKKQTAGVDLAAEPFGELMAYVCSYGFENGSAEYRIAAELGRHLGRFIYITDAADDLYEDIKSGSYNPFKYMYADPAAEIDREALKTALILELAAAERALELIDFSEVVEYGEIIRNIIYLGLPDVVEKTVCGMGKPKAKKRRQKSGVKHTADR